MDPFNASTRFDERYHLPAQAASYYADGHILAVNTQTGRAVLAADLANRIVMGRTSGTVNNLTGAHGDKLVTYDLGVFLYKNSATSPLLQSHYGKPCYIEDSTTVSASPGTNNVFAGFFRGFHNLGEGAWVDMRPLPMIAAFFGGHPSSNFRLSTDPTTGAPIFQLWNQGQETYQTVQLDGLDGLERLIIA
jgi:hypothetical protein